MTQKPYAMVPMGPNGELVRVEFGQKIEVSNDINFVKSYSSTFEGVFFPDYAVAKTVFIAGGGEYDYARLPIQKRPEIAERELVSVRDNVGQWKPRLFAGWDGYGRPMAWHTEDGTLPYLRVRTKDGIVWPPEEVTS